MAKKQKTYTPPSIINPNGMQVTFTREIHQEVVSDYYSVIKFIAGIGITGLELLPKTHTTQVTLLHSETARQYFSQRQNNRSVLDTDDLLDLEYALNGLLGEEAPVVAVQDELAPLRIDENDRLVLDLKDANDLQVDRCRILRGLTEVIQSKKINARDIDALLDPVAPTIPIATVDRRILGTDFDAFSANPVQYLYDESVARLDETVILPIDVYLPAALPLGKLSVRAIPKQVKTPRLEEHFPDIAFDGVKKIPTHEMEYS